MGDLVETKKSVTRYCRTHDEFLRSKEYKLLDTAIKHYEGFDVESFGSTMVQFAEISQIKSKNTMIDSIKKRLDQEQGHQDDLT